MTGTALYRLFGAGDVLLYVGITDDPRVRFWQHKAEKEWWPEVTTREITWLPTRSEALAAESAAILAEGPKCNQVGLTARKIRHQLRIPTPIWAEFGAAAEQLGTNRSALLRDYIAWVLRKPGAPEPRQVPEQ